MKRAILIGCNYPGTNAELKGCINDVIAMQEVLTTIYGFAAKDITIMIDTDPSTIQPTGKNIKAELRKAVAASGPGDELVVHFSGHGTQIPSSDPEETDGKDEAICPCDMNVICDGDLRDIFQPLNPDCKLTFVADCCHSGTLLDHDMVIITGPKAGGPPPPNVDVQAIQSMLAALGGKEADPSSTKNRALPFNDLCGMLMPMLTKMLAGEKGAAPGAGGAAGGMDLAALAGPLASLLGGSGGTVGASNFPAVMTKLFGADANKKSSDWAKYQGLINAGMNMLNGKPGAAGALMGALGDAGGAQSGTTAKPAGGGAEAGGLGALLAMCFGGGGSAPAAAAGPGAAYAAPAPGAAPAIAKPPAAGHKPPVEEQLHPDVGILITGCQDKETSADARPPGGKAHGALTNALTTVIKNHHQANAGYPLTYRNLVIGVREALAKTGFAQNPCLECSQKWADSPVISHQ